MPGGCSGGGCLCSACGSVPAAAPGGIRGGRRERDPAPLAEKASVFLQLRVHGKGSAEPRGSPLAGERHIPAQVPCRRAAPPPSLVPRRDDHGQGHAAQRDGCCTEEPLPGDGLRRRDQGGEGMCTACCELHQQQGRAANPTGSRDVQPCLHWHGATGQHRAPNAHPR